MLSDRMGTILKSIVEQYITRATPVPSQSIANASALMASPATIRNEMVHLEEEAYIIRPHTSAGSIPLDKGYRYYVESLGDIGLPLNEQRMIGHVFHQVERELEEWLSLAATLLGQLVRNMAVVALPKPVDCRFKHLELVALNESRALIVLVFSGARVRQQLINFNQVISQSTLEDVDSKLNVTYSGLTSSQILAKDIELSPIEQQITDCLIGIMQVEEERKYDEPCVNGLHFMLNQPEFTRNPQMLGIMELIEHRDLLKTILPHRPVSSRVRVFIGKENDAEVIHNYSVVISQYGIPEESVGIIGVVGPTRMPYARTIATVGYLSSILSELVADLYGGE